MIHHHVLFWLKKGGAAGDRDALVSGLETLRPIPVIRDFSIGVPARTEDRDVVDSSYDVSELMRFDSIEDQRRYQEHPLHVAFVEACGHLWDKVVVYDVEKL